MGDNDNDDTPADARRDDSADQAGAAGWSGPTPADEVPAEASADDSDTGGDDE